MRTLSARCRITENVTECDGVPLRDWRIVALVTGTQCVYVIESGSMQTVRSNMIPSHAFRLRAGAIVAAVLLALLSDNALGDQRKTKATTTTGKLYKWVDENGIVHYGDSVPAEYSNRERQVLNEQGVPIKTLQKELTPDEMAAELRRIEQESERAQAAERATQRDHILL